MGQGLQLSSVSWGTLGEWEKTQRRELLSSLYHL